MAELYLERLIALVAGIPIGFVEYNKVGVPITVLTLLVGWLLLVLLPA